MRILELTALYHATLVAFEDQILKEGLRPGGDCQLFSWCDPKYVYLSKNAAIAESFISSGIIEPTDDSGVFNLLEQGGVVFTIDAQKLDSKLLIRDTNFNVDDPEAITYAYKGVIHPTAIVKKKYFDLD